MERHDPWAPFERRRRRAITSEPTAPEPPSADELAEIAVAVEGKPEAKAILRRIEVGDTVDPAEVFSFFPDIAPEGWKADPDAADRMESKLLLGLNRDTWDETKGLDPELRERVAKADRFRARWERTFANILRRHWERRRAVVLAKVRSTQFRKGTPLWDPPGDVDLESRLDVLIDVEAWDRELRTELESALEDLRSELVADLDVKAAPDARNQEWPAWIPRWIEHSLTFNVRAAGAIRKVLRSNPTRVADVEEAVNDHVSRTMAYVGDQVATSLATGSIGEAQQQEAIRAGAIEKIWYSAQDGRVRPQHRHANGQRVPIDHPFRVRDRKGVVHSMIHPGDISAPPDLWMNCRCVALFVTDVSRRLWLGADGDVFDPYNRPTLIKAAPFVTPDQLGIEWKADPRDGDGDGIIDEGTPFERPAVKKPTMVRGRYATQNDLGAALGQDDWERAWGWWNGENNARYQTFARGADSSDDVMRHVNDILEGRSRSFGTTRADLIEADKRRAAELLLETVDVAPLSTERLYRGLRGAVDMKVGDEFDWPLTSVSPERSVSIGYTRGTIQDTMFTADQYHPEGDTTMLEFAPGIPYFDVTPFNGDPEGVTGGRFRVVSVESEMVNDDYGSERPVVTMEFVGPIPDDSAK